MHRKFSSTYLAHAAESPDIRALKERSYELMVRDPGASYLDIGCGPGIDTVALAQRLSAKGRVTGIDADPGQVRIAARRAADAGVGERASHIAGVAHQLPFADRTFAGCRCERLLQHLAPLHALQAFAEALRVVDSGARLVFIDTDWPSFSIHTSRPAIERRLASQHLYTIANPFAARGLVDLFVSHGLKRVAATTTVVRLDAAAVQRLLADAAVLSQRQGLLNPADTAPWFEELGRLDQSGRLYASVNMVCCVGEKPGDTS